MAKAYGFIQIVGEKHQQWRNGGKHQQWRNGVGRFTVFYQRYIIRHQQWRNEKTIYGSTQQ
ncbi:hypothetical protein ES692_10525 [Psychroserpens burtonensis]|uniref:Uncharacterized protein n=1 Tax=Psychroserpens burtonensis TaxID=49278 RepID=A0A5C7B7H4_9FLAO|nr:hypothetical protein [Psychroserpens burtonensis]TXE17086.1 hypothetical protein ES692_10525 [Psychroserpens burtonensis]